MKLKGSCLKTDRSKKDLEHICGMWWLEKVMLWFIWTSSNWILWCQPSCDIIMTSMTPTSWHTNRNTRKQVTKIAHGACTIIFIPRTPTLSPRFLPRHSNDIEKQLNLHSNKEHITPINKVGKIIISAIQIANTTTILNTPFFTLYFLPLP